MNVLSRQDMENVKAVTDTKGETEGANELLNLLPNYKNWYQCLIQVLQDKDVKLGHVADMMLKVDLDDDSYQDEKQREEGLDKDAEIQRLKNALDEVLSIVAKSSEVKITMLELLIPSAAQCEAHEELKYFPSYDEVVKRKLFTIFEKYIYSSNVIHVFWKYDTNVLTKEDIQHVDATVCTSGITAGALKLLELLPKYKNWIPCLIQVLKDEQVELDHVAEMILQEIAKIKSDASVHTTVKALAKKDLSELRLDSSSSHSFMSQSVKKPPRKIKKQQTVPEDFPSYDEVVKRKLFTIFEKYIYPSNVLHVFWKCDPNVLKRRDIQHVDATVRTSGITAGALKLLELLPKYKNWIPCLIQVLKDEEVELDHVAEMILQEIEEIRSDTNLDKAVKALAEKDLSELRFKTELAKIKSDTSVNTRSKALTKKLLKVGLNTELGLDLLGVHSRTVVWSKGKKKSEENETVTKLNQQIQKLKIMLGKKKSEENETVTKLNQQIQELKMMLEAKSEKKMSEHADDEKETKHGERTDKTNEKALAEENISVEESQTKLATDDLLNVILRNTKEQSMKESLMLYFARCGQLKALEDLIEGDDNINIDKYDSEGKTALMYAASAGSLECVTLIVGRNPDVNVIDKRGQTPLMLAARSKGDNIQCLQKLLDAGADVNVKDTLGNTALAYAAKEGNDQCVQALVDSGTDVNTSDTYGKTPLMLASRSNAECVKILLKAGASPDVKDADQPPLIYAVNFGNVDCVQVLLKAGSDVNISDKMAKTALMFAAEHSGDNVLCLQKLLDAEADVDIKDLKGRTALAYAASAGNVNCVDLLLRSGGQKHLNTPDKNERTPLMLASKSYGDNVQCVETLLSSGADINMKDSDAQTALDYATKCGNIKCQDLLHFF